MMEALPVEMRQMIMVHFSNAELLTISLVSKKFSHEARSLMSARSNVIADLGTACQNVLPFVSDIDVMDIIPFCGIKIQWSPEEHRKFCTRPAVLNPSTLDLLNVVLWKRLSVKFHGGSYAPKKCPALQLVRKILTDFCYVLEQLEFNNNPKLLGFALEIVQDCRFPRLKVLKLGGPAAQNDTNGIKKSLIKAMVARAPNLLEYQQDGPPDLSENLLEGSSSAVLVSNCDSFNPALHEFAEGFTGTVKLKEINLYYTEYFSMRRFKRTVPRILQSSFDTLHSIQINLAFLLPLMRSGVRLEKLTDFATYMDYARWELMDPRIFSLLQQFDFTRVFPKLTKVQVCLDSCYSRISADHISEFVEQAIDAVLEQPAPDRAANIKHLEFFESLTSKAVPFFAGMFPHVETFATTIRRGVHQFPYGLIWNHWPELKELQVEKFSSYTEKTWMRHENLDGVFCGIFPQEVALLRKQDEKYLRAVHIVPVMPSITCLRGLRTLRMVRRHYNPCGILSKEMDPMFSKITALIAFRRCPHLSVNIQTNSQHMLEALHQLKPHAAVELVD